MMDSKDKDNLDDFITGNYGEDQDVSESIVDEDDPEYKSHWVNMLFPEDY
jgi:hypothetical protein